MNPGELRHRITIQKLVNTQDTFGQPLEQWPNVVTVWASVKPIVGKEFFAAETVNSEVTHKIKIRYRAGITPDMRVKFKNRYFQIIGPPINYKELNTELQLMCRELV
jgi:SPP1 family predicted phage head-tail adaptor